MDLNISSITGANNATDTLAAIPGNTFDPSEFITVPVTFANLTIVADEWFQPYLYHPTRKRIFWDAIRNSLPLDQFQARARVNRILWRYGDWLGENRNRTLAERGFPPPRPPSPPRAPNAAVRFPPPPPPPPPGNNLNFRPITFFLEVYIEYSTETDVRRALGSQGQMDIFKFSQYPVLSLSLLSTRTTQFKVYKRRLNLTDSTPPVLRLNGDAEVFVPLYAPYTDLGVTATDDLDGTIQADQIIVQVKRWNETIYCCESQLPLDTSFVTGQGPYTITYDAYDYKWNQAVQITRTVHVFDPCARNSSGVERTCPDTRRCSVLGGRCGSVTLLPEIVALATPPPANQSAEPLPSAVRTIVSAPVKDTQAPTIFLLPADALRFAIPPASDGTPGLYGAVTMLTVGGRFVEPGYVATDNMDPAVQKNVKVRYAELVDTSAPTPPNAPYAITYDVSDFSGNRATTQIRLVFVNCPTSLPLLCPPFEGVSVTWYCASTVCGVPDAISRVQSGNLDRASDNTAPVLRFRNSKALVTIYDNTTYVKCPENTDFDGECDSGVIADDKEDGDISYKVRVCEDRAPATLDTLWEAMGTRPCGFAAQMLPGRYLLTYTATDKYGAKGVLVRTLLVLQRCPDGEVQCPDGTCSDIGCLDYDPAAILGRSSLSGALQGDTAGVSFLGTEEQIDITGGSFQVFGVTGVPHLPVNKPPTISLVTTTLLTQTIQVTRGYAYRNCRPSDGADPAIMCELGVTAIDPEEGDISAKVYVCPPPECLATCRTSACAGHQLNSKGVRGCLDTEAEAGTTFIITFLACDSGEPRLSSSTFRTVNIVSRCAAGQYDCDGVCYNVPCAAVSRVDSDNAVVNSPPALVLLPPGTTLATAPSAPAGSPLNLTQFLTYAVPAPISFSPCTSVAAATACAAVATDVEDGDVTRLIKVYDITPCSGNPNQCLRCSPESLTLGKCLPGTYYFRYVASDEDGASAEAFWTFVVEAIASNTVWFEMAPSPAFNLSQPPSSSLNETREFVALLRSNDTMNRELLQLQLARYGLDLASVRSANITDMTIINRNTDDGIYDPNYCICTINFTITFVTGLQVKYPLPAVIEYFPPEAAPPPPGTRAPPSPRPGSSGNNRRRLIGPYADDALYDTAFSGQQDDGPAQPYGASSGPLQLWTGASVSLQPSHSSSMAAGPSFSGLSPAWSGLVSSSLAQAGSLGVGAAAPASLGAGMHALSLGAKVWQLHVLPSLARSLQQRQLQEQQQQHTPPADAPHSPTLLPTPDSGSGGGGGASPDSALPAAWFALSEAPTHTWAEVQQGVRALGRVYHADGRPARDLPGSHALAEAALAARDAAAGAAVADGGDATEAAMIDELMGRLRLSPERQQQQRHRRRLGAPRGGAVSHDEVAAGSAAAELAAVIHNAPEGSLYGRSSGTGSGSAANSTSEDRGGVDLGLARLQLVADAALRNPPLQRRRQGGAANIATTGFTSGNSTGAEDSQQPQSQDSRSVIKEVLTHSLIPSLKEIHRKLADAQSELDALQLSPAALEPYEYHWVGGPGGGGVTMRRRRSRQLLQGDSSPPPPPPAISCTPLINASNLVTDCTAPPPTETDTYLAVILSLITEVDQLSEAMSSSVLNATETIANLDDKFTVTEVKFEAEYVDYKKMATASLDLLTNRTTVMFEQYKRLQALNDTGSTMMGALSALLEGSVATAVEAADFLGLTTAMIVEGLGLSEDQWYFDDYEKCLLNRAGKGEYMYFTINAAAAAQSAADIAAGLIAAPPPPPPVRSGYSLMAAAQMAATGRNLLSYFGVADGTNPGGDGSSDSGAGSMFSGFVGRMLQQGNVVGGGSLTSPGSSSGGLISVPPGVVPRQQYGGYEVEVAAGKPPAGLTVTYDSRGIPERRRTLGPRGNRVIAGLMLHQERNPVDRVVLGNTSAECTSEYGKLRSECQRTKYNVANLRDLGGIGLDPVFDRGSALYSPDVASRPWAYYNFSEGNTDISTARMPFGFTHYPVPDLPDGYPIVFDTRLGKDRAQRLLAYLSDGRYLSSVFTRTMLARLLVYNPDCKVFGYWRATFTWDGSGFIKLRQWLTAIPAVDYGKYIEAKQYWQFIPDWVMVLFVFLYGAATLLDVVRALQAQRRLQRARDGEPLEGLTPEELFARKRRAKQRYVWRMSPVWVSWEVACFGLMVGALVSLYLYVFQLSPDTPTATTYDVYDADVMAPARFFMVRKNESGWNPYLANVLQSYKARSEARPTNDSIGLSNTATDMELPSMPLPGEDYRWLLPDDYSGLQGLAGLYSHLNDMDHLRTLYFFLQALVLFMLMVRLMQYVSFQPHLAVIGGAIVRALPLLTYWAAIAAAVVLMFVMLLVTCYGYRVEDMAGVKAGVYGTLQYIIVINRNWGHRATATEELDMSHREMHVGEAILSVLVRGVGGLLIQFVLPAFVFAILLRQHRRLRRARHGAPTIWADLRNRWRWWRQRTWQHAPSNKAIDATIDWATRPEVRYSWAYGVLYNAIVRGVAAAAGGATLAKAHPTQHKDTHERAILLPGGGSGSVDEPDPRVCPRYNLRSLMDVFEGLLLANKHLRKELFLFLNTNVEDTRTKRMKALSSMRKGDATNDASARAMADTLARLLLQRFGRRVRRRQARDFNDLLHTMRRRLGGSAGSQGSMEDDEFTPRHSDDSRGPNREDDDEVLPTGVRVGDLRHGGYSLHNAMTMHELQLQSAVQTAMRNIHSIRENMGREIGDDPQLLATLFVAQFAGMIPEPDARPAGVRPSLYRQRVQQSGGASGATTRGPSRLGSHAAGGAVPPVAGPVAAVTDGNTPEGMLTRALQAMLAPGGQLSASEAGAGTAEPSQASIADGMPRGRSRPRGARSKAPLVSELEVPEAEGGVPSEPTSPSQLRRPSAAGSTRGSAPGVAASRTSRSMLPARMHSEAQPRAASFTSMPATLGNMFGARSSRSMVLPQPSASSTYFTPALGGAPSMSRSEAGSVSGAQLTAPEPLSIRRPQVHKMRSLGAAAAAASRARSFISGAPGEIAPASPSAAAAAAAAMASSTPPSYASRSGLATPRGDLIAAQISALPPDSTVIFATGTAVVQRLISHIMQLMRELRGVQADTDSMLRSTILMTERLAGGAGAGRPMPRRAAKLVPGALVSPQNSPPVSPQTEKPPGWEDSAAAKVAAANAAVAAAMAAAGSRPTSLRIPRPSGAAPEEAEDMLPLPPLSSARGMQLYGASPSSAAARAAASAAAEAAAAAGPIQAPWESAGPSQTPADSLTLPPAVEPMREAPVVLQPEMLVVQPHAKEPEPEAEPVQQEEEQEREPIRGGDAAALAAAAMAFEEAEQAEREALAEEEGLTAHAPPPAASPGPGAAPARPGSRGVAPGAVTRSAAARPSSSASNQDAMRVLSPPDSAHRRMLASSHSHSRSGSPRVQSPLLPAEAIVRLGPERPRGPTAVLIDGRPAQEAEEEAGAQQHLDEGRRGAVRRPGSVLRDEQGVEVLALPETVPEEDAAEGDEEGSPGAHRRSHLSGEHSRRAFSRGPQEQEDSSEDDWDADEDAPASQRQQQQQGPPVPPAVAARLRHYVPPPSREPAAFSEPEPGLGPVPRRMVGGVPMPPLPAGVPSPIRRRPGASVATSGPGSFAGSGTLQPKSFGQGSQWPQLEVEASGGEVPPAIAQAAAAAAAARASPARRVQLSLPPEMERRKAQLERQQELLAAAQAAVAARKLGSAAASLAASRVGSVAASRAQSRAASRGASRVQSRVGSFSAAGGPAGLEDPDAAAAQGQGQAAGGSPSGTLTSPLRPGRRALLAATAAAEFGIRAAPGEEPSNAAMMAADALQRRQAEDEAAAAKVGSLLAGMRSGLSMTQERLAVTGRAGSVVGSGLRSVLAGGGGAAAGSFGASSGGEPASASSSFGPIVPPPLPFGSSPSRLRMQRQGVAEGAAGLTSGEGGRLLVPAAAVGRGALPATPQMVPRVQSDVQVEDFEASVSMRRQGPSGPSPTRRRAGEGA